MDTAATLDAEEPGAGHIVEVRLPSIELVARHEQTLELLEQIDLAQQPEKSRILAPAEPFPFRRSVPAMGSLSCTRLDAAIAVQRGKDRTLSIPLVRDELLLAAMWYASEAEVPALLEKLVDTVPRTAARVMQEGITFPFATATRQIARPLGRDLVMRLLESGDRLTREIAIPLAGETSAPSRKLRRR